MNHQSAIVFNNLVTGHKTSGGYITVSGPLSAFLRCGAVTCLLGPNGAGKSTLMSTLCGFIPLIEGDIVIQGKEMNEISPDALSRLVSVVLTDRPKVDNMTVEMLVETGRSPYTGFWGRLSDEDRYIVAETLKIVGVTELKDRMINTLSDGERQKVMIAKAIAQSAPIIILDEPTAFLDYPSKVEIFSLLRTISREKNIAILISTHDLDIALQLADELWLLDKNLGLRCGTVRSLSSDGTIADYFNSELMEFDAPSLKFIVKK